MEVASGLTFDAFLKTRLFDPLGMTSTFFVISTNRTSQLANIYQRTPQGLQLYARQNELTSDRYFSPAAVASTRRKITCSLLRCCWIAAMRMAGGC